MRCDTVLFSGHALVRMFERKIRKDDVTHVIQNNEVVFDYPDDQPYPSKLLLGFIQKMPIHVVVAQNKGDYSCIVITAYRPSEKLWQSEFNTRE